MKLLVFSLISEEEVAVLALSLYIVEIAGLKKVVEKACTEFEDIVIFSLQKTLKKSATRTYT